MLVLSVSFEVISEETKDTQTEHPKQFVYGAGVDLLLGFLPMPLVEVEYQYKNWHYRAAVASALLYGKLYGELAYQLKQQKNTQIYFNVGGFYAGIASGHFYEVGIDFSKADLNYRLRGGLALFNTDGRDPWNGKKLNKTLYAPRFAIIWQFR